MKKLSPQHYAHALKVALEEAGEVEREHTLDRFLNILFEDMMLPRADEIIVALERLYDIEEGKVHAHVASATVLSEEEKQMISVYVKEKTDARMVVLEEQEDASLIGGATVRYENRLIDGSIKRTLEKLSTALKTR